MNWTRLLATGFLLVGVAEAQELGKADLLFSSHEVLDVTITAPFKTLMRKRPTEEDFPGSLSYVDDAGTAVELYVGLRTRGKYRRQTRVCSFAPIRLNFKKSETKNTVFRKQDKLKLVNHCRINSNRYEQVALKEYLAYRFLNEMTELSFRVRLLRITYVDSDRNDAEEIRYGFLIEHKDRLAKRLDLPSVEITRTSVAALVGDYTNLTSMFQYFIANTDFSPITGTRDEFCCHNGKLFGNEGQLYYSIPYDFDMAGMTDSPYATPNPALRIRNVRQRMYRGRCANNPHLPTSAQVFQENKESFYALVENMPGLSGSSATSMYALMDTFYNIIDDPRSVEKKMAKKCL